MKAATHQGTCQVCGQRQKLPGGKLARHGYTIDHGWQQGTCWGSEELPLEVSCDLIEKSIQGAEKEIVSIQARIEQLLKPAVEPKATVFKTVYAGRRTLKIPTVVEIATNEKGDHYYRESDPMGGRDYCRWAFQYSGAAGKTALDFATYLNSNFAKLLERKIPQIQDYITHQTEVVKSWKPMPLHPIKGR